MIIWINGAFGSGKTQTAFELHRRAPNSYVYDPENVGYFLRRNIPREICQGDFQNYPLWREFNYSMLRYLEGEYGGIIIVPMTIVSIQYFDEIIGRLWGDGVQVRHFMLCASKEVILKRLRGRRDGADSWPARQIDRCTSALSGETFRHHIDTDDMTIECVAEEIALLSGISISPDRRSGMRRRIDRWCRRVIKSIVHTVESTTGGPAGAYLHAQGSAVVHPLL